MVEPDQQDIGQYSQENKRHIDEDPAEHRFMNRWEIFRADKFPRRVIHDPAHHAATKPVDCQDKIRDGQSVSYLHEALLSGTTLKIICLGAISRLRRHRIFDGRHQCGFRKFCFPAAAFLEAGAHGAQHRGSLGAFLAALLDDEWRAALGARLGDGLVGGGEVALGIAVAAVEDAAAALLGHALDQFPGAALRAGDAQGLRADVSALGVAGAADELSIAPVLFDKLRATVRTLLIERLVGLAGLARSVDQPARGLTFRVTGAGQERPEAAALDGHFFAAVVAILDGAFALAFLTAKLRRKVFDVIAFRITGAAQKEAVAADALEQLALAAFFAFLSRGDAGLVRLHLALGLVEVFLEAVPEILDRAPPGQLALFDFVEFFFEARGEAHVEDVFKTFYQQIADFFAEHRGSEAALVFADVLALDDGGNNRRVGGRPANALFLELFDQRGFGVARRRLGEVLLRAHALEPQRLALGDPREGAAFGLGILVFFFFLVLTARRVNYLRLDVIHGEVAVELEHRAGGAESVVAGGDINRGLVEDRREHLRSHKPLPDELVELEHVRLEILADVFGRTRDIAW